MTTAELVRSAGAALASRAEQVDAAGRLLAARMSEVGDGWRGFAADAADERAQELTTEAARVANAFSAAADALRVCAAQLADAEGLSRRADQLARHHEDADLLAASQRLRAEAGATTELALRRAAGALRELRAPPRPHRSQAAGFAQGLWGVLANTAKQGWNLNPELIALHPTAWWSTLSDQATGSLQAAEHPAATLSAAVGLDQLRTHAYGEWAGTLLGTAVTGFDTGGAGRIAGVGRSLERDALIVAEDGRWTVRHKYTIGGQVRPRRGVTLPGGFPTRIRDLSPGKIKHILVSDRNGGGHRSGTGKRGKTEFPPHWSDDDIVRRVMQTATRPATVGPGRKGTFVCSARFDEVNVLAIVSADGHVLTGYPLPGGRGVVDNKR